MQIIKLNATESTNTYLKALAAKNELQDFTVVTARHQTLGRGQLSAKWESEKGKNLSISILKKFSDLSVNQNFLISINVSLAILEGLRSLSIPNLSIKWPNDILSGNSKICGILIENLISGTRIRASIIGFGLNVNQESFNSAPNAASLKQIMGRNFDLDTVFYDLIQNLNQQLQLPISSMAVALYEKYEANLFRINEVSSFKTEDEQLIRGCIRGVAQNGKLQIELENGSIKEFGLKEIQLQY